MFRKLLAIVLASANIFMPMQTVVEPVASETTHYYPATMVVVDIDEEEDLVTLEDSEGFVWEFYGVDDWFVGDLASVLMYDSYTPEIEDDEIVKARYAGIFGGRWIDGFENEY